MTSSLSAEEQDLLAKLIEDGWPLPILASGEDKTEFQALQAVSLSLVRHGLAGIYGRRDDARHVPLAEAEAIIREARSWDPQEGDTLWFMSTTEAGNALLGAPNEW